MIGTRVGIDIRDDMVVAVEVKGNLRQQVVSRIASAPLSEPERLGEALASLVEQLDLSGGSCVSVIPGGQLSYRNLKMPFRSARKIGQTLGYELEAMLPTAVDGLVVDFVLATKSDQPEVLAAMVDRPFLAEYLAHWQQAAVDPAVLEVRNVSLAGCLVKDAAVPETGLLLDLNDCGGSLVMFRQGRVVLVRDIYGQGDMRSGESGAAACNRFGRAVLNTVRSFADLQDVDDGLGAVYVTGPLSSSAEVVESLQVALGLPVETVDLATRASLQFAEAVRDKWDGATMDGALALALRGRPGEAGGFNFRKEEFAVNRPLHRFKKELLWSGAFAAVLALLVSANFGIEYFYLQQRYDALDQQIKTVFRETLPQVTRIVDPVQQMRVKIREMKKAASGRADGWAEISALAFLQELSVRIPASYAVRLTRLAVDQDGARVKGETDNFNNVDAIKKNLEESPLFGEVAISSANLDRTGSKVQFELRIQ